MLIIMASRGHILVHQVHIHVFSAFPGRNIPTCAKQETAGNVALLSRMRPLYRGFLK
jgi:hypothetical protein